MARALLLDEMLSPKIAAQLRRRGHDVCAITERQPLIGLPDDQILLLGATEHRAVVTLNIQDFAALHANWLAEGRPHGGLVYVSTLAFPQDRGFIGVLVRTLNKALRGGELPGAGEASFLART